MGVCKKLIFKLINSFQIYIFCLVTYCNSISFVTHNKTDKVDENYDTDTEVDDDDNIIDNEYENNNTKKTYKAIDSFINELDEENTIIMQNIVKR